MGGAQPSNETVELVACDAVPQYCYSQRTCNELKLT